MTDARYVLGAAAIGIGATLLMDLWNLFLKRAFKVPSLNYCLLGRWVGHMPRGIFRHASIAAALLPALVFGIGTVVFPLFIMQPAFGLGVASSKAPNPIQARLKSFATHAVFGVGLYVCGLGVRYALQLHG